MANYEKDRYWTVFEKFIDADFRPVTKGGQANVKVTVSYVVAGTISRCTGIQTRAGCPPIAAATRVEAIAAAKDVREIVDVSDADS